MAEAALAPGDDWFLRKVLELLIKKYANTIRMGRVIMKQPLYRTFSWWFRFSRTDTREVLTMLAEYYPGIKFSNRGLKISTVYLDSEVSPLGNGADRSGDDGGDRDEGNRP